MLLILHFPQITVMGHDVLPSWGDPLLPVVLNYAEADDDPWISLSPGGIVCLDDTDITWHPLALDPMKDKEMISLMQSAFESNFEGDCVSLSNNHDSTASALSIDDETRCTRQARGHATPMHCPSPCNSSHSNPQAGPCFPQNKEHSNHAWSIETSLDRHRLTFTLRTDTGVSMRLFADEVLDSLQAILDDAMEPTSFHVQGLDGESRMVDSRRIVPVISRIIRSIHPGFGTSSTASNTGSQNSPETLYQDKTSFKRKNRDYNTPPPLKRPNPVDWRSFAKMPLSPVRIK